MIEFSQPRLDVSSPEFTQLPSLLKEASRAMGMVISLRKKLLDVGIKDTHEHLLPKLREAVGKDTMPRVIPSYTLLMWFTIEVLIMYY